MAPHECRQEKAIDTLDAGYVRHQKELYEGLEGRPSMQVRLDRCERVIDKMMWVSMSLLVTVLISAGTLIWQSVVHSLKNPQTASTTPLYGSPLKN